MKTGGFARRMVNSKGEVIPEILLEFLK